MFSRITAASTFGSSAAPARVCVSVSPAPALPQVRWSLVSWYGGDIQHAIHGAWCIAWYKLSVYGV